MFEVKFNNKKHYYKQQENNEHFVTSFIKFRMEYFISFVCVYRCNDKSYKKQSSKNPLTSGKHI